MSKGYGLCARSDLGFGFPRFCNHHITNSAAYRQLALCVIHGTAG